MNRHRRATSASPPPAAPRSPTPSRRTRPWTAPAASRFFCSSSRYADRALGQQHDLRPDLLPFFLLRSHVRLALLPGHLPHVGRELVPFRFRELDRPVGDPVEQLDLAAFADLHGAAAVGVVRRAIAGHRRRRPLRRRLLPLHFPAGLFPVRPLVATGTSVLPRRTLSSASSLSCGASTTAMSPVCAIAAYSPSDDLAISCQIGVVSPIATALHGVDDQVLLRRGLADIGIFRPRPRNPCAAGRRRRGRRSSARRYRPPSTSSCSSLRRALGSRSPACRRRRSASNSLQIVEHRVDVVGQVERLGHVLVAAGRDNRTGRSSIPASAWR